jgi:hypothetical protein
MKLFVAYIFQAYDTYSKFIAKISETAATLGFDFMDKVSPGGTASAVTSATLKMGVLANIGADGSTKPTGSTVRESKNNEAAKAILAAIAGTTKAEKEKASDTKGKTGGNSTSSVSGNVIGVGQNPVIAALQDQTEIAKQSMTYLEMIAYNFGPQNKFRDITEKGGTPVTPATR